MLAFTLKVLVTLILYPKLAIFSVMMIFAAGSASGSGDANALVIGIPLAFVLLFSPILFWIGAGRLREGVQSREFS